MDAITAVARAQVLVIGVECADVVQQSGQECAVDLLLGAGGLVLLETHLQDLLAQLGLDVAPFLHPVVGEEVTLTKLTKLVARKRPALLLQEAPEVEEAQEIRVRMGEGGVNLIGGGALLMRTLARILNAQRGGDHQHLG